MVDAKMVGLKIRKVFDRRGTGIEEEGELSMREREREGERG